MTLLANAAAGLFSYYLRLLPFNTKNFLCISLMQTYSLLLRVRTHIHTTHAHTKRVMPRNNPLCRLIDQITSRWNTLPNSDHHTHRLPFRNGAFLFVQSHPRRSFHLASPRRTSLPPTSPSSRGHWGGKVARTPFFISPTSRNSSMRNH